MNIFGTGGHHPQYALLSELCKLKEEIEDLTVFIGKLAQTIENSQSRIKILEKVVFSKAIEPGEEGEILIVDAEGKFIWKKL